MNVNRRLLVAGLFSGIGGFEIGLAHAGHRTVLVSDIDLACQDVLMSRVDADLAGDLFALDRLPQVDVVTAGFPCQSFSPSGLTQGLRRPVRRLLEKCFALIAAALPEFVVLENVPFIRHVDKGGAGLRFILRNLERSGYRWAYRVVDTLGFGLPQRRRRWVLVAARSASPAAILLNEDAMRPVPRDPEAHGFYWTEGNKGLGWTADAVPPLKTGSGLGIPSPPAVWDHRTATIIVPGIQDAERLQGFEGGWTKDASVPRARWRLIGNAVSVPVAEWLGSRLQTRETFDKESRRLRRGERWPMAAFGSVDGRYAVDVSTHPIVADAPRVSAFLREPKPLSYRASQGFYDRASQTDKINVDAVFLRAVREHARKMKRIEARG